MKKIAIRFGIMLGCFSFLHAQQFITTPNDTASMVLAANTYDGLYIYQRNISGDTLNLAWTKVFESIPSGWDYSLCDKGTCYPGYPPNGTMAITTASDSGFMATHVNPFTISGTLTVRFYVYDISAPNQGDTITFIYTYTNTTGDEDNPSIDFNLFPNPSSDYLNISTNLMEIPVGMAIYDMNGKVLLNSILQQNNESINITSLPTGIYIMEIANKKPIRKSFIKQ